MNDESGKSDQMKMDELIQKYGKSQSPLSPFYNLIKKYELLNATPAYKIFLLKQEFKLVKRQIKAYKDYLFPNGKGIEFKPDSNRSNKKTLLNEIRKNIEEAQRKTGEEYNKLTTPIFFMLTSATVS